MYVGPFTTKACESLFWKCEPQHFKQSLRDPSMRDIKNLTAHAISCGHAKFCCVTMSSILWAKTLKQAASARDKSEEVEIHGWKNAQSLIVTVLCLLQSTHVVMNITQFVVDSCDINLRRILSFETNVECLFIALFACSRSPIALWVQPRLW